MCKFDEMSKLTTVPIIACQYRKHPDEGKPPKVWDSCGAFTYDTYKDNPLYECRRLVVYVESEEIS